MLCSKVTNKLLELRVEEKTSKSTKFPTAAGTLMTNTFNLHWNTIREISLFCQFVLLDTICLP